jgi:hypothetical protein
VVGTDSTQVLRTSRSWRIAVVALRVGYGALAVVAVGLLAVATGRTPWILAAGMVCWLLCALSSATFFLRARAYGREPRLGFLAVRAALVHDSVHALPH